MAASVPCLFVYHELASTVSETMSSTMWQSPSALLLKGGSEPLVLAVLVAALLVVLTWVLSLITANYSHVDRLWSISPGLYMVLLAAGWPQQHTPRSVVTCVLVLVWCVRLSFNFARKGGYHPKYEDYRWAELQAHQVLKSPISWHLFNLLFISTFQHILLFTLILPYLYVIHSTKPWSLLDVLATALFLVFLLGETVADEQQWNFQTEKHRRLKRGESLGPQYKDGFLRRGLFEYSRHPNFFCEVSIWWSFYLFSVSSSGCWVNDSLLGPVLLAVLFHFSTNFTEAITARKYPTYREYQRTTSRLVPWWPRYVKQS